MTTTSKIDPRAIAAGRGYFHDRAPCNGDRVRHPATLVDGEWLTPHPTDPRRDSIAVPGDVEIHAYDTTWNGEDVDEVITHGHYAITKRILVSSPEGIRYAARPSDPIPAGHTVHRTVTAYLPGSFVGDANAHEIAHEHGLVLVKPSEVGAWAEAWPEAVIAVIGERGWAVAA